jgi:hypothetical protein
MPTDDTEDAQRLVRLGKNYTQIQMSPEARKRAVEAAHWRTCSPHEWTWTSEQQADMALYVLWASQRLEMIGRLADGSPVTHEPE